MDLMNHAQAWKKGRKIRYIFWYYDSDWGVMAKNKEKLKFNKREITRQELYSKGWAVKMFACLSVELPETGI